MRRKAFCSSSLPARAASCRNETAASPLSLSFIWVGAGASIPLVASILTFISTIGWSRGGSTMRSSSAPPGLSGRAHSQLGGRKASMPATSPSRVPSIQ